MLCDTRKTIYNQQSKLPQKLLHIDNSHARGSIGISTSILIIHPHLLKTNVINDLIKKSEYSLSSTCSICPKPLAKINISNDQCVSIYNLV